jgi:hypothetical protein
MSDVTDMIGVTVNALAMVIDMPQRRNVVSGVTLAVTGAEGRSAMIQSGSITAWRREQANVQEAGEALA